MSIHEQIREAREELLGRGIHPHDLGPAIGYFFPELAQAYAAENGYSPFRFGVHDGGAQYAFYDDLPGYGELPFDAFTALADQERASNGLIRDREGVHRSIAHDQVGRFQGPHGPSFATTDAYDEAYASALGQHNQATASALDQANQQYDFRAAGSPEARRLLRVQFLKDWALQNAPHAASALGGPPQQPQGGDMPPQGAPGVGLGPAAVAQARAAPGVSDVPVGQMGAAPVDQPGAAAPQGPAPAQGQAGDYVNKVMRRRLGV